MTRIPVGPPPLEAPPRIHTDMRLTVVIPSHNRPRMLRRAVASVLAQRDVCVEVIVVDDGSDPPLEAEGWPDTVRIARLDPGRGVSRARNHGIERAETTWVAFLDDDDVWSPEHARRVLEAGEAGGSGMACAATWNVARGAGRATLRDAPRSADLFGALLGENAIGTPSCVIARRDLLLELGGFDPAFSVLADWDLWLRIARRAPVARSQTPTVAYVSHADNMSLDLGRLRREFTVLAERYEADCRTRGRRFGAPGFPRWMARLHREQGRRIAAAGWYLRSALFMRHRRDLARAAGIMLGESVMSIGRREIVDRARTPPEWVQSLLADAPAPLAGVRAR